MHLVHQDYNDSLLVCYKPVREEMFQKSVVFDKAYFSNHERVKVFDIRLLKYESRRVLERRAIMFQL